MSFKKVKLYILHNNCSLTLLNGRTLTATLTQSLLCMSEALALIAQQAGYQQRRPSDRLPHTERR